MKCRLIDQPKKGFGEPGDMYWVNVLNTDGDCAYHKPEAKCDGVHLWVVLPNGAPFDINDCASTCPTHRQHPCCWQVSGKVPNISLHPSIEVVGSEDTQYWHGWLTNGELIE